MNKIQDEFFYQLLERIWSELKHDSQLMVRDTLLRNYFIKRGKAKLGSAIQTDMDLLDLSDSEGEESADDAINGDVFDVAIKTLLTISWTNSLQEKAQIIERSILMAMRAHK